VQEHRVPRGMGAEVPLQRGYDRGP
jgi:hypothetical protein